MTIQLPIRSSIFVCEEPIDFRGGFNATAAVCRLKIQKNPLDGGIFVFINRNKSMVRLYLFDGHGEFLITKRVAKGRFAWWKKNDIPSTIVMEHIQLLLRGGDPKGVTFPSLWKELY